MPGAAFAQARIAQKFFLHRYTRVPRGQVAAPNDYNDWGLPEPVQDTDVGAPAKVADVPCSFMASGFAAVARPGGNYDISGTGVLQTNTPTLLVAFDDPLAVGDVVEDVHDAATGYVLMARAQVEREVDGPAQSGAPIYKVYSLIQPEVV